MAVIDNLESSYKEGLLAYPTQSGKAVAWRLYNMSGDFCTQEGAQRLKNKIEEYWRGQGYDVNIDLVESGFVPAMRSARTDVRSNMVNGMPQLRAISDESAIRRVNN